MSDASGFGKLVPGFDFLQSLVKNAGSAMPGRQTRTQTHLDSFCQTRPTASNPP